MIYLAGYMSVCVWDGGLDGVARLFREPYRLVLLVTPVLLYRYLVYGLGWKIECTLLFVVSVYLDVAYGNWVVPTVVCLMLPLMYGGPIFELEDPLLSWMDRSTPESRRLFLELGLWIGEMVGTRPVWPTKTEELSKRLTAMVNQAHVRVKEVDKQVLEFAHRENVFAQETDAWLRAETTKNGLELSETFTGNEEQGGETTQERGAFCSGDETRSPSANACGADVSIGDEAGEDLAPSCKL